MSHCRPELNTLAALPGEVRCPTIWIRMPEQGIVHFGVRNFHGTYQTMFWYWHEHLTFGAGGRRGGRLGCVTVGGKTHGAGAQLGVLSRSARSQDRLERHG